MVRWNTYPTKTIIPILIWCLAIVGKMPIEGTYWSPKLSLLRKMSTFAFPWMNKCSSIRIKNRLLIAPTYLKSFYNSRSALSRVLIWIRVESITFLFICVMFLFKISLAHISLAEISSQAIAVLPRIVVFFGF